MNQDSLFDESLNTRYGWNRIRLIILVVVMISGTIWSLIRYDVRKPSDTELPPKPWTKASLPALHRNVQAMKEDAAILDRKLLELHRSPDGRVDAKVWEEIFYTPEHYSAFVQYRSVEMAHVRELQPDLAAFCSLVTEYQDARHAIAANASLANKAAAVAALDKRFQPQFKNPDYAKNQKAFDAARAELFGDPEFDHASESYRHSYSRLVLSRRPELEEYFRSGEGYAGAYANLKGKANALAREVEALENSP